MSQLIFIGTRHSLQKALPQTPEQFHLEFRQLVQRAAQDFDASTIAEEMNEQALGGAISLCRRVADDLGLQHVFCDPSKTERTSLGLPQEDSPSTWSGRESEWLSRLQKSTLPALFVCGSNHIDSFSDKCRLANLAVTVLEAGLGTNEAGPSRTSNNLKSL